MPKLPYMQFYPLDWLRDTRRLSPQAKAAWIDILALAWNEPKRGVYERSISAMKRELGIESSQVSSIIDELKQVADVQVDGESVLVMSRRMKKDESTREYERKKKRWQREKGDVPNLSPKCPPIVPQEKLEVRSQKLEVRRNVKDSSAAGLRVNEWFAKAWEQYPRKLGRKAAERHFRTSVKTPQDWADLQNALDQYVRKIRKDGTEEQYVQHGSTWFNNWRDWVSYPGGLANASNGGEGYVDYAAIARSNREAAKLREKQAAPEPVSAGVRDLPDVRIKAKAGE